VSAREKAAEELRSYAVVTAYLFVCFAAILLYKAALLEAEGLAFAPIGTALVKALILGKFILIGEALGVGTRLGRGVVLASIVRKTLLFGVLLVVLTVLEELVVGWVHHRPAAATLGELFGAGLPERLASILLMVLVLVPLIAVKEMGRALGPGGLRRALFGREETSGKTG
jgi:hypothetical protein